MRNFLLFLALFSFMFVSAQINTNIFNSNNLLAYNQVNSINSDMSNESLNLFKKKPIKSEAFKVLCDCDSIPAFNLIFWKDFDEFRDSVINSRYYLENDTLIISTMNLNYKKDSNLYAHKIYYFKNCNLVKLLVNDQVKIFENQWGKTYRVVDQRNYEFKQDTNGNVIMIAN